MTDLEQAQMDAMRAAADRAIDSWGMRAIAAEERAEAAEKQVRHLRMALEPFSDAHRHARSQLKLGASLGVTSALCGYFVTGSDFDRAERIHKETAPTTPA